MEEFATSRVLQKASEIYDGLEFNTDALFNEPAPEPWVSFMIGGILSFLGILLWLKRVRDLKTKITASGKQFTGELMIRAMISAAVDADSSVYVIVSFSAASFLFLGGIQHNFRLTLGVMIALYTVTSFGDTVRVVLAYSNANSLADVIVTSALIKSKFHNISTDLKPSNVYEDLGRGKTIVIMTFLTQIILIGFVCADIFENDTTSCRDGTSGCPIGGTLGSWGFYVLGIFMACVFMLGPKTAFGQSEQNPAYWLQLLLAAKQAGAKVTWFDPVKGEHRERFLITKDWRIWFRFFMSFVVNGVGFHILVHALPVQVAYQSSFTSVVFRAVGMMYLVDLDDTPGYTLTVTTAPPEPAKEEPTKVEPAKDDTPVPAKDDTVGASGDQPSSQVDPSDTAALSAEAQRIIDEARAKLEALANGGRVTNATPAQNLAVGGLLIAATTPDVIHEEENENGGEPESAGRGINYGDVQSTRNIGSADAADEAPDIAEA